MTMHWDENIEQVARDGFSVDEGASRDAQTEEVLEEAKAAGIDGDREWARDEVQRTLAEHVEIADPDADDADDERAPQ